MILKNGVLSTTIPGQYDGQIHSIEWFHNGEWRRIIDTVYPLQDSEVLDDTLDSGGFCFTNELKPYPDEWMTDENGKLILDENGNKVENPNSIKFLKQLAPIRIIWDSEEDYKAVTGDMSDVERKEAEAFNADLKLQIDGKRKVKKPMYRYRIVDEVNIHGEGRLFKFTVKTVEATKLLELVQCDTMTFTKYLNKGYSDDFATGHSITGHNWSGTAPGNPQIKKFNGEGTKISLVNPGMSPNTGGLPGKWNTAPHWELTFPNGITKSYSSATTIQLNQIGMYTLKLRAQYEYWYSSVSQHSYMNYNKSWDFSVVIQAILNEKLTILSVLERILKYGITRREGIDKQKFVLADSVKEIFEDHTAPEFCITRATMWEALKTVAGHVHCIPRLNWDETTNSFRIITFDKLGEMKTCELKAMHNNTPIAWDISKSLDSYCGEINTYVDNLVNTKDETMGSIVEPYDGGWMYARNDENGSIVISSNTVCFTITRPNYRIIKCEIKFENQEADITPYIFESAEYKVLSADETVGISRSLAYALKYEQGGKAITGLQWDDEIGAIFSDSAIINIAKQCGITGLTLSQFTKLQYRITYSPISSARVVQMKPYIDDCNGYSRVYNVAGNTIESEYLGEHLKGAIARLGNDIEYRTYMFERGKDVPKPGTLLDGKYIMKATTQMSTVHFIKATLVLSNDYNQKNEYVAIDSSIRYYDVSEKQSYVRHSNYCEKVIIGDYVNKSKKSMMTKEAIEIFAKCLGKGNREDEQIAWAWFKGVSRQYEGYNPEAPNAILLPCLSQSSGNSLVFNFSCQDNYGAGYGIIGKYDNNKNIQSQIAYGNLYGEFDKMELRFGYGKSLSSINIGNLAKEIPLWGLETAPNSLINSGNYPLNIGKDSREQLNFTYQLQFVTNRKTIILGSALGNNNPLVTNNWSSDIGCFWLPKLINKFDAYIDVSDLARIEDENCIPDIGMAETGCFELRSIINNSNKKAYAIAWVDLSKGMKNAKLIVGENYPNGVDDKSRTIVFNFCSNE